MCISIKLAAVDWRLCVLVKYETMGLLVLYDLIEKKMPNRKKAWYDRLY